ncbi:hypothetical protein BST97_07155 [Nonlabens spongiae]|uniref:Uncharacterized protein n=1 Tax=Nonlabens spongiae TaxID=331648 RepID=A0A1W6MJP3_9FLAO|nr:hypothetical protein BST97_07155 [Nonlabens spongiae]
MWKLCPLDRVIKESFSYHKVQNLKFWTFVVALFLLSFCFAQNNIRIIDKFSNKPILSDSVLVFSKDKREFTKTDSVGTIKMNKYIEEVDSLIFYVFDKKYVINKISSSTIKIDVRDSLDEVIISNEYHSLSIKTSGDNKCKLYPNVGSMFNTLDTRGYQDYKIEKIKIYIQRNKRDANGNKLNYTTQKFKIRFHAIKDSVYGLENVIHETNILIRDGAKNSEWYEIKFKNLFIPDTAWLGIEFVSLSSNTALSCHTVNNQEHFAWGSLRDNSSYNRGVIVKQEFLLLSEKQKSSQDQELYLIPIELCLSKGRK